MQLSRLFEMVYLLLHQQKTTTRELAEHFEVSRRTILRDIETLSAAGVPVYTTQGKGGGVFILDNYVLDKTTISDEEQNEILFALQSLSSSQQQNTGEVFKKLRAFFDKNDADWIAVDFSRWGNTDADKAAFETLKGAILDRHPLMLTYASSYGETTKRTVYPLKLIYKSTAWYLQAYCLAKQDYRTFKICRILSMDSLPETFAKETLAPPPIDGAAPPGGHMVALKLRFSHRAAYLVYDEFGRDSVVKNEDGSFLVTAELPEDEWLYGFLLSFGTAVEVLSPRRVREALLKRVTDIQRFYQGN